MHVDRYAARWNTVFGTGRSRPDLIGMTPEGQWVVAEAKGRSNSMEPELAAKLHSQKGMIREIDGRPPDLSLGCVSSFPVLRGGQHGPLQVDAVDPEPGENAVSLDIDASRFLRAYYEPFAAALAMGEQSELSSDDVLVVDSPSLRLSVGLRRDVLDALAAGEDLQNTWKAGMNTVRGASEVDGVQVRRDGTFVRASWQENFRQQDIEKS